MHYTIDVDTYKVEAKHEDADLLAEYIMDNHIEEAVYLVSDPDSLCLEFTIDQMSKMVEQITHEESSRYVHGEDAAESLWGALEEHQKDFPKFTKALGKKLIRAANKPYRGSYTASYVTDKPKNQSKKTKEATMPRTTTNQLEGMVFTVPKAPRQGTARWKVYEIVDENLGEITYEDLLKEMVASGDTEKEAISLIKRYLNKNFLEETI